jgi:hypothetical protein
VKLAFLVAGCLALGAALNVSADFVAGVMIALLLAALAVAVWHDVHPLWRGEPLSPDEEREH